MWKMVVSIIRLFSILFTNQVQELMILHDVYITYYMMCKKKKVAGINGKNDANKNGRKCLKLNNFLTFYKIFKF